MPAVFACACRSVSSWLTNVENRSITSAFACAITARVSSSTIAQNTIGVAPRSAPSASIRATPPRAWRTFETNGIVTVLNLGPLNRESRPCPNVSAVTPVRSDTKHTMRAAAAGTRATPGA
jgi:hypothetical protein